MDIVSHGLWGGAAFGRKNKKSFWVAFLFGVLPDLLAFGPFFIGIQSGRRRLGASLHFFHQHRAFDFGLSLVFCD